MVRRRQQPGVGPSRASRACRRPLLVGEAPARTTVGASPFFGRSGARLAELAELDRLRDGFDAVNLLDRWPGRPPGGKGSSFDLPAGRLAAQRLWPKLLGRRVVLVGRRTAAAFGLGGSPYLAWVEWGGMTAAVLPHPSGVNRWFNEAENVEAAARFLRDAARA